MSTEKNRSCKTRQVMDLIRTSSSSDVSPSLIGLPEDEKVSEAENKKNEDVSVEEKLKQYTDLKRGKTSSSKASKKKSALDAPKNPMLHIPDQEESVKSVKQINAETAALRVASKSVETTPEKNITIDINQVILKEKLEKALKRFNTCSCDICCAKISELVLREVPIKIVTVPESKADETIEKYREYTTKQISNAIVKIIMKHKRKPFH